MCYLNRSPKYNTTTTILVETLTAEQASTTRRSLSEYKKIPSRLFVDGCGYAQVFFPTTVDIAVERNRTRATQVTEAVSLPKDVLYKAGKTLMARPWG